MQDLISVGPATTYAAITVGATIKLPGSLKDCVLIRPEVRYDRAMAGGTRPYHDSTARDQFTAGFDVIVSF
jgi:hypothetical protein